MSLTASWPTHCYTHPNAINDDGTDYFHGLLTGLYWNKPNSNFEGTYQVQCGSGVHPTRLTIRNVPGIGASLKKEIRELIDGVYSPQEARLELQVAQDNAKYESMSEKQVSKEIKKLEKQMIDHAKNLEFEKAAKVRDQLRILKEQLFGAATGTDSNVIPMTRD